MILSISGVVLLGVIAFLFFKKDGLKASHGLVCALFGFYVAGTAIAPSITAAWREPGQHAGRNQVLTLGNRSPTHPRRQMWPGDHFPAF